MDILNYRSYLRRILSTNKRKANDFLENNFFGFVEATVLSPSASYIGL
jgi:hypothetical protein